jgi:YHS domain-containing protein
MRNVSIVRLFATTFSVIILVATMVGYSSASSSESGDDSAAISKLETIKENHMATKRQEAIKADIHTDVTTTGHASTWLTKVNSNVINMVTNRHEGVAQAEIVIDGKTYYGSCKGCAENMINNTSTRFARDPYTNKLVDKAEATIFTDSSGRAWYFESGNTQASFIDLASQDTVYGYEEAKDH